MSMCEGASRRGPNPLFTNHKPNPKFCNQRLVLKSIVFCVAERCRKIQKCSHNCEVIYCFYPECHQEGRKELNSLGNIWSPLACFLLILCGD